MAAIKNFAYSVVAVAPSPAASGTSLTVSAGQGALFALDRPATIYPSGVPPLESNAEIVMVTGIAGDVLTITRTQEGTAARTILVGDQIAQCLTAAEINGLETDIAAIPTVATDPIWDAAGDLVQGTGANTAARLPIGTAGQVLKVNAGATAVEWGAVSGTGDVVGPTGATDGAPALFDTTTGKLLKNSTPTGTGNPVLQTSPTLTTPNIGTPSAGVLTNCTGLPTGGLVDGSVTLAKMANLAQDQFIGRTTASTGVPETATITAAARTVLDDTTVAAMVDTLGGASSTGTGGLARATSPTFVTPVLGTPASGDLSNTTAYPVATTSRTGATPQATAPAAGLLSVLAIANGETVRTDKALFDTTNPANLGTAAPGTAIIAARRDHVHAMPNASDVGLGNVTNDTQTKAAIVPNAAPAAGEILVGNAGGTAYAKAAVSGDATLASTGALTIANAAVSLAKMANLAQDQFIGRTTASTGVPETATITAAARTVLDDTTVAAMVDTLGGASSTGTGGLVRTTSPTLVTPALGTPASGNLGNCTGLPASGIAAGILGADITLGESTGQIVLDPVLSADGKWSGIVEAGTAGAALAFGNLCYFAVADSRWEKTDADAAATAGPVMLGMCVLAAAADGDPTVMLRIGKIRADAIFPTLTIGAPVYVGLTAGEVAVTETWGTGDIIRIIGYGITANELYFNPDNTFIEYTA